MNQFKKLARAFTTWRSSSKSSSDTEMNSKHDDHTDAMHYLNEVRRLEYEETLRRINPAMTSANIAGQAGIANQATWLGGGVSPGILSPSMSAQHIPTREVFPYQERIRNFTVEKVDNGYILRSGKYSKICKDMDDLKDQFIVTIVEQQLDK